MPLRVIIFRRDRKMDRQRLQVIESLKISDDSWLSGPSGKQRDKIAGNNSLSVGAVTNTV
ncbi:MAG TPA: hypothetical protein VIP56_07175 [Nitrososphaeraceae archaeon]